MKQKELAELLGVSTATISMALRGKGRISPDLRDKIIELSQTHRVPVRRARRGGGGAGGEAPAFRVGYCGLGEHGGWLQAGILRGVAEPTAEGRAEVLLYVADLPYGASRVEAAEALRARLPESGLDALVLAPSDALIEALVRVPLPKVMVGYYNFAPERLDAVVVDSFWGGYRLTKRLIARGARRVACVRCRSGQGGDFNSDEKFRGYLHALEEAGLPAHGDLVFHGDFSYRCGERAAKALLDRPKPPDGVFLENDWMTSYFLEGLRRIRSDVPLTPDTLPMAHFGDSRREPEVYTQLDRVEVPTFELGRLAMQLLADRIQRRTLAPPLTIKVMPAFHAGTASPEL